MDAWSTIVPLGLFGLGTLPDTQDLAAIGDGVWDALVAPVLGALSVGIDPSTMSVIEDAVTRPLAQLGIYEPTDLLGFGDYYGAYAGTTIAPAVVALAREGLLALEFQEARFGPVAGGGAPRWRIPGGAPDCPPGPGLGGRALVEADAAAAATRWASGLDDLSRAAGAADRNGLTRAGRALQKHGGRPGSAFPDVSGHGDLNATGQGIVDDILRAPGEGPTPNRFGGIDVVAQDGRGVRYDADGGFMGFLEPPR